MNHRIRHLLTHSHRLLRESGHAPTVVEVRSCPECPGMVAGQCTLAVEAFQLTRLAVEAPPERCPLRTGSLMFILGASATPTPSRQDSPDAEG
jgi:hypothetical protein